MLRRDGEQSDDAAVAALLPGRIAALQARGQRLGGHGWDINLLILLADDAAALAEGCRRTGEEQHAARLDELAAALAAFVDPPNLPDPAAGTAIAALLDGLSAQPLATPAAAPPRPRSTPIQRNGFATAVTPPADYFLRWRTDDAVVGAPLEIARAQPVHEAPVVVEAPPVAEAEARITPGIEPAAAPVPMPIEPVRTEPPAPAPAVARDVTPELPAHRELTVPPPPAAPEPPAQAAAVVGTATQENCRNAFHLGGGDELDTAIDAHLVALGYSVEHLEHAGEVEEVLRGVPAHLVVIGAPFEDYLDAIGEEVKQARERATWPIPLIALSRNADLDARLRALRAGCDALIGLPAATAKVLQRMTDAVGAEQVDPYRIMIIDDDRQQALFAEAILRKAGMQTLAVTEALVALERIEDFMPELILVDLYMPGANGLELTALIRQHEAFISTPIVFLSGEEDTDKQYEALSVGGDDFLAKPIRPQHLIGAVTSRVRRARQLQRQYLSMVAVQDIPTGVTATIAAPAPAPTAEVEVAATPAPERENAWLAAAQRIRTLLAREDPPLELAFQPIVSLQGEENEQFQVLLRLCDGDRQVFSAAQILPVAAAEGLMPRIDRWVVERCVAMIAAQQQNGTSLRLFATVSLDSIGDAEFADWLAGLLRHRPIPSGALVVDVHLGDADDAVAPLARFVAAASALGLLLALSGYDADCDQHPDLAALPVDFLKLSARYVAGHDAAIRAELISLVDHAHAAGQRVIAPRVEDATTTAALWSAGVDFIQGHFVQKPAQDLNFDFHTAVT